MAKQERMEMASNGNLVDSPAPRLSAKHHGEGGMDFERWVNQHMDLLKMKSMTSDLTLTGVPLPKRLADKIFKVSVDERNSKGETLMISVIRYVTDEIKQVRKVGKFNAGLNLFIYLYRFNF